VRIKSVPTVTKGHFRVLKGKLEAFPGHVKGFLL
jgi:hypothetical protein